MELIKSKHFKIITLLKLPVIVFLFTIFMLLEVTYGSQVSKWIMMDSFKHYYFFFLPHLIFCFIVFAVYVDRLYSARREEGVDHSFDLEYSTKEKETLINMIKENPGKIVLDSIEEVSTKKKKLKSVKRFVLFLKSFVAFFVFPLTSIYSYIFYDNANANTVYIVLFLYILIFSFVKILSFVDKSIKEEDKNLNCFVESIDGFCHKINNK